MWSPEYLAAREAGIGWGSLFSEIHARSPEQYELWLQLFRSGPKTMPESDPPTRGLIDCGSARIVKETGSKVRLKAVLRLRAWGLALRSKEREIQRLQAEISKERRAVSSFLGEGGARG